MHLVNIECSTGCMADRAGSHQIAWCSRPRERIRAWSHGRPCRLPLWVASGFRIPAASSRCSGRREDSLPIHSRGTWRNSERCPLRRWTESREGDVREIVVAAAKSHDDKRLADGGQSRTIVDLVDHQREVDGLWRRILVSGNRGVARVDASVSEGLWHRTHISIWLRFSPCTDKY